MEEYNVWANNNTFIAKCKQDLVPKSIAMSITDTINVDNISYEQGMEASRPQDIFSNFNGTIS